MFIGVYKLEGKNYFNIYYKCKEGYDAWHSDTFSPCCEDVEILDFKISGKNYKERKASLEDIAIDWQLHFSQYSWSYGELAEIGSWFYEKAKKYGLIKDFEMNAII